MHALNRSSHLEPAGHLHINSLARPMLILKSFLITICIRQTLPDSRGNFSVNLEQTESVFILFIPILSKNDLLSIPLSKIDQRRLRHCHRKFFHHRPFLMKTSLSSSSALRTGVLLGAFTVTLASQAFAGPGVEYWLSQGKAKKTASATTASAKNEKANKPAITPAPSGDAQIETAQASPTTSSTKSSNAAAGAKQR